MTEKLEAYRSLVRARKACARCAGLINPSTCAGGLHDSDEIGPWTRWQGHLDTELMVVGQDWGDVDYFTTHAGLDESRNPTNRRLRTLLAEGGFDVADVGEAEGRGTVFFTNAVLCLKTGGLSGPVNAEWFRECGPAFLRPQIEIVRPRAVVTLGERAYGALMRAFGLRPLKFREAVEAVQPIELVPEVGYFPVYHCSPRVLAGTRTLNRQREDWRRIGAWLGREALKSADNDR